MHVGPDFAICIMHVLSAASDRVRVINGVSFRFVAAGPKFRYNFIANICQDLCRVLSLSADPKRMGALTLLKRRSGVYDKYPTDKLWACNGNIAGYCINLARVDRVF